MPATKERLSIINQIIDLSFVFRCANPDPPTKVYLTKQAEIGVYKWLLETFPEKEFGRTSNEGVLLRKYGIQAWPNLFGMEIILDSDSLRVC